MRCVEAVRRVRARRSHPEKTRLIEFGRQACSGPTRAQRVPAGPETFTFLGFTYILRSIPAGTDTSSFKGRPGATVSGRSYRKSRRNYGGVCTSRSLFQGSWLKQVVTGHFAYSRSPYECFPGALSAFQRNRHYVTDLWRRTLRRRSPEGRLHVGPYDAIGRQRWLPEPRILHPWPDQRFAVKHPEVGAGCSNWARPGRICAGGAQQ